MSLFINQSSSLGQFSDCCTIDVSETIERDCLSVLHKLHDQVNGLQLVQVVVQPLAKLFNPASLATLVANVAPPPSAGNSSSQSHQNTSSTSGHHSHAATSSSQNVAIHHNHDLDASSTHGSSSQNNHSRVPSFTSAFGGSGGANTSNTSNVSSANNNSSLVAPTNTYMMSPDTAQALIARLDTDRDVNWLMEIIGYGLSMPFSMTGEQDSVKDCCTIYCEWLASALLPYKEDNEDGKYQQLSKLVPIPIRRDPNRYARKMLSHLYNVFLPRQVAAISQATQKDQSEANLTAVSRQAVLCHRVLRTIESVAQNPTNLIDNQSWDHLIALLLTVNDKLLSPPTEPDDIGTQLHDRILGVLFDLMLLASSRSIPTRGLWKTFHEMCINWRHRPALVDHWKRITLSLTRRVAVAPNSLCRTTSRQSSDTNSNNLDISNTSSTNCAIESAIASMNYEDLSQTWYRFLNLIGNPVELSDPSTIGRTDEFYRVACASDNVLDPRQHPCLNGLPQVFVNSMVGLREIIETFLGSYQCVGDDGSSADHPTIDRDHHRGSVISLATPTSASPSNLTQASNQQVQSSQAQPVTPTQSRKSGIKSMAMKGGKVIPFSTSSGSHTQPEANPTSEHQKSGSISGSSRAKIMQPRPSLTSLSSRSSQTNKQPQFRLSPDRPKCNSILHIFGDWLFSAALIGSDLDQHDAEYNDTANMSEGAPSFSSSSTTTEVSGLRSLSPNLARRKGSQQKSSSTVSKQTGSSTRQVDSATTSDRLTLDPPLCADSFEAGQAEAMAILCKIFSSKATSEDISPTYLSRFYLCIQHCLAFCSGQDARGSSQQSSIKRQLLASVLINSTSLLQKDLDGINLLIPSFIKAIEFVFECSERDIPIQPPPRQHARTGSVRHGNTLNLNNVTNYDLRKACIMTLLNLLAYPLHFQDLVIRSCLDECSPTATFASLRPRLLKLLFVALQTDTDPVNMQILFGGLSTTIHDLSSFASRQANLSRENSIRSRTKVDVSSQPASLHSNSHQDDNVSQNSFVFNSSSGLIIKSLHVACHLLINVWKHDTQVSLAALELLTGIARVSTSAALMDDTDLIAVKSPTSRQNLNNNSMSSINQLEMQNEYKQTTKWICDYICNQCSRPPPAHSRDMHSTIVAAYQCLRVWFHNQPQLLDDADCINTVLEVVELGVSGQKSRATTWSPTGGAQSQSPVRKADKIMKPSSMRVREAAESLLNVCMNVTGGTRDSLMGAQDSALDELSVVESFGSAQCKNNLRHIQDVELRRLEASKQFKYFCDDDLVMLSLFEGLNLEAATKDSLICLLRTPFGRHCWQLKFNLYSEKSRELIIANKTLGLIKRPFQQCSTPTSEGRLFGHFSGHNKSLYFNTSARFFPASLDECAANELDRSVASLDDYAHACQSRNAKGKEELDKVAKILHHQLLAEQKVMSECSMQLRRADCDEGQPVGELESARMLFAHLGLKSSLGSVSSLGNGEKVFAEFVADLRSLDRQSVRTCDVANVFYVRRNRTSAREILASVRERHNVSLEFFAWILELAEPTVVKQHSRWTGKPASSWTCRVNQTETPEQLRREMLNSNHGGSIFDGDRMTLYWADVCQELAFLLPHRTERLSQLEQPGQSVESAQSGQSGQAGQRAASSSGQTESVSSLKSREGCWWPTGANQSADNNSDAQSLCSLASDASGHSTRAALQLSSPVAQSNSSWSRADVSTGSQSRSQPQSHQQAHKRKSTPIAGCDVAIIICWLESADDLHEIPCETLLRVAESGHLVESNGANEAELAESVGVRKPKSREFAKFFISPMKNGLYRVNLVTSFGRHWLALPLVDGMSVGRSTLASLVRESVLNLCRRRRLDADSYQPPHVRRRLKIQEICANHKTCSRLECAQFYNGLFRSRAA